MATFLKKLQRLFWQPAADPRIVKVQETLAEVKQEFRLMAQLAPQEVDGFIEQVVEGAIERNFPRPQSAEANKTFAAPTMEK